MADSPDGATDDGGLSRARLEDRATHPMGGWALDAHRTQDLVLTALDRAVARHRPPAGVLHHADRGSPYTAAAYPARLVRYGMTPSRRRQGNCGNNACIESWHRLVKKEVVYRSHFRTRADARTAIFEVHRGLRQPAPTPQRLGLPDAPGDGRRAPHLSGASPLFTGPRS